MKSSRLKILLRIADRREKASEIKVAVRRRAVEEAAQFRAQAQLRMERASLKAENERIAQARAGMDRLVNSASIREGHEYGYLLLWKALGEFADVRKADIALAERRSELAQVAKAHRELMRRRQKLEAIYNNLVSRENFANAMLEGDS